MGVLEQKKFGEYKESGGTRCPFCGSDDEFAYDDVFVDNGTAFQVVRCRTCNNSWEDFYELKEVRYTEVKGESDDKEVAVTRYIRGGSYFNHPNELRVSRRMRNGSKGAFPPICFIFNGGFRVVRKPKSV